MRPWLPLRREPRGISRLRTRGGGRSPSGSFPIAPATPSARSLLSLCHIQTLAGRGGSVSRRDHDPKTGKRAQLAGARKSEGKLKSIPHRSSGEGVWGGGASLREAASSPESPSLPPSFREGARGRGLFYRKGSSLAKYNVITCTTGRIACRRRSRRLARLGCRRRPSSGGDTPSRRERCAS